MQKKMVVVDFKSICQLPQMTLEIEIESMLKVDEMGGHSRESR